MRMRNSDHKVQSVYEHILEKEQDAVSKIAIFTNSIYTMGGVPRVVCVMANEFVKRHDVTIFTMDAPGNNNNLFQLSPQVKVERYLPYKGDAVSFVFRAMTHVTPWVVYDLFPSILNRAYCCKRYAQKMYELIGDHYDIVIAAAWQLSIILGQVCKEYPHTFKAIGWEHNSYEAYFREKYFYLYRHEEFYRENVKYLNDVVVLNQDYARKYKEFLDIDCQVIYNPKSFTNEKKSKLINKHFVTCGRFDNCKGFDLLIDAFSIFAESDREWDLWIAGDGSLQRKLRKKVNKLGLGERIIFLGRVEDVGKLLSESSVYLLTSRYEGFPMSVTEAFETGLPVLSFDIPAMFPFKEIEAVETVECYDVQQFAKAMFDIAGDYEKRYRLGQKALAFARDLSPEKIAECWDVYMKE